MIKKKLFDSGRDSLSLSVAANNQPTNQPLKPESVAVLPGGTVELS